MSNIGELFKNLSKNSLFESYVKELEHNKTPKEIVERALNDDALMTELRNIIDDIPMIQNKMETIVNQKMKKIHTTTSSSKKVEEPIIEPIQEEDIFATYLSPPIHPDNVVCVDQQFYLEKVGNIMRLVTQEYDMYY